MDGPASTTSVVFDATESCPTREFDGPTRRRTTADTRQRGTRPKTYRPVNRSTEPRFWAFFAYFQRCASSAAVRCKGGASTAASDGRSATYTAAEAMKPTNQA